MCCSMETASEGGITRGRLKLLFVADEECSNLGTRAYMKEYGPSDYGIIGEPTGLAVAAAHRGVSRDYIEFTAPARHALFRPERRMLWKKWLLLFYRYGK